MVIVQKCVRIYNSLHVRLELAAGSPFHEPQAKNLECLPVVENVIWIKLGHELGVCDCYLSAS